MTTSSVERTPLLPSGIKAGQPLLTVLNVESIISMACTSVEPEVAFERNDTYIQELTKNPRLADLAVAHTINLCNDEKTQVPAKTLLAYLYREFPADLSPDIKKAASQRIISGTVSKVAKKKFSTYELSNIAFAAAKMGEKIAETTFNAAHDNFENIISHLNFQQNEAAELESASKKTEVARGLLKNARECLSIVKRNLSDARLKNIPAQVTGPKIDSKRFFKDIDDALSDIPYEPSTDQVREFCSNVSEALRAFSKRKPGYSPSETDEKILSACQEWYSSTAKKLVEFPQLEEQIAVVKSGGIARYLKKKVYKPIKHASIAIAQGTKMSLSKIFRKKTSLPSQKALTGIKGPETTPPSSPQRKRKIILAKHRNKSPQ